MIMSNGEKAFSRKLEEDPYLRFTGAEDASPRLAATEDATSDLLREGRS